jgi:hypothetical protein
VEALSCSPGNRVVAGTIDFATAKVLGDLMAAKMKSIDLREYEKRIVELE